MSKAAAAAQFLPGGETGNKAKSVVYIIVAILVVVIVIVVIKKGTKVFDTIFGSINSIFEAVGLADSAEEKKADADAAAADAIASATVSPFNPSFFKNAPGGTPLMTSAKAAALSDQIYDSVGVLYDDPESGLSAFKQCNNWAQVSFLCDMFQRRHSKDAYGWLRIKYDTTAQKDILAKIVNYCVNLPKY